VLPDATPAGSSGPFEEPRFPETGELDLDDIEDDEDETEEDLANRRSPGAGADEDDGDGDLLEQSVGNRAPGGVARAVLEHVARSIVDEPDAVEIDVSEGRSGVRLALHVAPSDMGRVIGRRGRVAQAIRTLVRAAAAREGTDAVVDIVDD
jgi:predicted RNA-binding protein YlqC (UPF0109 family)